MNKNVPVADLELDDDTAAITRVIGSLDLAYLPVGIDTRTAYAKMLWIKFVRPILDETGT